jgi:hypothetical protein
MKLTEKRIQPGEYIIGGYYVWRVTTRRGARSAKHVEWWVKQSEESVKILAICVSLAEVRKWITEQMEATQS